MKKFLLVFSSIFLLYSTALIAQRNGKVHTTSTTVTKISKEDLEPFSKGKWEYAITRQNLGYSHQNIKVNDVSQGSQSQFSLNLDANYYVAKSFGVGLELDASLATYKNGYKQTSNDWMAWANFTYGVTGNNNFNFYARAGLGVGESTSKYTPVSGNSTTDKSHEYGYKFCIGFPIQLERDQPVYFTPEFHYRYLHDKFDGGTEKDNRFGIGLKLETFLFCREMECDHRVKYAFSHNAYDQNRSYFGVSTRGMMDFGTVKTEYDNNFPSSKQTYNTGDLSANYMYYIVNNFALGADVDFGSSMYKYSGSSNKSTFTSFAFKPMIELNIPVEDPGLRNLFVRAGYGFGMQRNKFTVGSNTTTTKYSTTDFCVGLGYNFFFHKGLSFTPIFEYDMATSKNKTTDAKEKLNGIELSMGVRKFF